MNIVNMHKAKSGINWHSVGRRVRELRGLDRNQAEFASRIGISQGQLSRYEKGNSEIGAEALLRLAEEAGKSIEWLLTGKESLRKKD
jgi:transcriptional regulator with XRE-family HTH domain